ncbi:Uncharacterised protein [Bordetella pertussis]|nr:Uncharacterised protein [Bordetella pertussis]CFW44847.1 Uncharacterised protein [Bordetella pertussis]
MGLRACRLPWARAAGSSPSLRKRSEGVSMIAPVSVATAALKPEKQTLYYVAGMPWASIGGGDWAGLRLPG